MSLTLYTLQMRNTKTGKEESILSSCDKNFIDNQCKKYNNLHDSKYTYFVKEWF